METIKAFRRKQNDTSIIRYTLNGFHISIADIERMECFDLQFSKSMIPEDKEYLKKRWYWWIKK